MRRVTFEIDETLMARAERLAAARGVTVETMLTELLTREMAPESETSEAYRARMEMVEMARRPDIPRKLVPWTREELYDPGVSGNERDRVRGGSAKGCSGEVGQGGDNNGE